MGQIGSVLPEVPLFLGETARDVVLTLYHRLARRDAEGCAPILAALERANTFHPGVPMMVGDLRITPLLVDHSAFDAYMFLIEGDGLRILHTGDFRNHGPRGKALYPVLRRYVGQVDYIVRKMKSEIGGTEHIRVIATGGLSRMIASETSTIDIIDGLLTLKGLRLLYERNARA